MLNARIERLPVLVLSPHNRCNCRCVMCDIWKLDSKQEISVTDLERHLDDIERLRVEWLVFSGGEPLMHSDLFRLAAAVRARGIRTTLLTTGLLLERYAKPVAANLDDAIVSLDGPRDIHDAIRRVPRAFDMLHAGVCALHRENPDFPVSARCTVQKVNHTRLRDTARAARALGLRSISFLAADLTSSAFNRPTLWTIEQQAPIALRAEDLPALDQELDALSREWESSGFVAESREKLERIALHFRANLKLAEPAAPRCNAPWVSAVIEADGTVRPCFFHRPIGRLNGVSLTEILNGPAALHFREHLNVATDPICQSCVCSLYRTPD